MGQLGPHLYSAMPTSPWLPKATNQICLPLLLNTVVKKRSHSPKIKLWEVREREWIKVEKDRESPENLRWGSKGGVEYSREYSPPGLKIC